MLGNDLEFATDGFTALMDNDALPDGVAQKQYSAQFKTPRNMEKLQKRLNSMDIWEAK